MFEVLFLLLFIIHFVLGISGFVLQCIFLRRLKNDHPQVWEKLGRPTLILNNTITNGLAVFRFVQWGEYESLKDDSFIQFSRFMKWCHRIFFVNFATLLVLFCVKLWSR